MTIRKHTFKAVITAALLSMNATFATCNPSDFFCKSMPEWGCLSGFDVGVDFIWWNLCRDGLDYAIAYDNDFEPDITTNAVKTAGRYKFMTLKWEPGFRVRVAKQDIWCDLDLIGTYTYIKSCNKTCVDRPDEGFLQSTLQPGFAFSESLDYARADYELLYQSFDILFATDYSWRKCHNFRPFCGVSGLFLNQKENSYIRQDIDVDNSNTGNLNWKDDYSGFGLKVGSEYTWILGRDISLYATASGTITVGDHTGKSRYRSSFPIETPTSYDVTFHDKECITIPGYHVGLGFLYEVSWCGNDFGVRIGYEFQEWHNVPNLRRNTLEGEPQAGISTSGTSTTIGLHGLFAGFDLSF